MFRPFYSSFFRHTGDAFSFAWVFVYDHLRSKNGTNFREPNSDTIHSIQVQAFTPPFLIPHSSTMHRMRNMFNVQCLVFSVQWSIVYFASLFSPSVSLSLSLFLIIHCLHLRQNTNNMIYYAMHWLKTRKKLKENWLLLNSIFTFIYAEIFLPFLTHFSFCTIFITNLFLRICTKTEYFFSKNRNHNTFCFVSFRFECKAIQQFMTGQLKFYDCFVFINKPITRQGTNTPKTIFERNWIRIQEEICTFSVFIGIRMNCFPRFCAVLAICYSIFIMMQPWIYIFKDPIDLKGRYGKWHLKGMLDTNCGNGLFSCVLEIEPFI